MSDPHLHHFGGTEESVMGKATSDMTLEEQKLAVCEKLPELIQSKRIRHENATHGRDSHVWVCDGKEINWPTEGLAVCHEAEHKLLDESEDKWIEYIDTLKTLRTKYHTAHHNFLKGTIISAPHEQRLEALCRVWWPERFE